MQGDIVSVSMFFKMNPTKRIWPKAKIYKSCDSATTKQSLTMNYKPRSNETPYQISKFNVGYLCLSN